MRNIAGSLWGWCRSRLFLYCTSIVPLLFLYCWALFPAYRRPFRRRRPPVGRGSARWPGTSPPHSPSRSPLSSVHVTSNVESNRLLSQHHVAFMRTCVAAMLVGLSLSLGWAEGAKPPVSYAILGLAHDHANGFIPRAQNRPELQL